MLLARVLLSRDCGTARVYLQNLADHIMSSKFSRPPSLQQKRENFLKRNQICSKASPCLAPGRTDRDLGETVE